MFYSMTRQEAKQHLRQSAHRFREALVTVVTRNRLLGLHGAFITAFPRGACGETSHLLSHYLRSQGFTPLTYRWGYYSKPHGGIQSHAWLEHRRIIIDITADQFPKVRKPVIVTLERDWYRRFETQPEGNPYYDHLTGEIRSKFDRFYGAVLAVLQEGD